MEVMACKYEVAQERVNKRARTADKGWSSGLWVEGLSVKFLQQFVLC
jgi:hypothetical protein